jgi:hypothetical protein
MRGEQEALGLLRVTESRNGGAPEHTEARAGGTWMLAGSVLTDAVPVRACKQTPRLHEAPGAPRHSVMHRRVNPASSPG